MEKRGNYLDRIFRRLGAQAGFLPPTLFLAAVFLWVLGEGHSGIRRLPGYQGESGEPPGADRGGPLSLEPLERGERLRGKPASAT